MADSIVPPGVQQKLAAEVIGTFVLVFFGCGSVVYSSNTRAPSTLTTIGLTFGVAVMVMAYAFGRVSGGHFNPAVSAGAAISGRISWRETGFYVLAQLVGAFLGALVLFALMHGFDGYDATNNMGQNSFGDVGSGYAAWAAFLLEMVGTAMFLTVILAVTDQRFEHPALAPLAIGLSLSAIHFVLIPATGTSVNPARSIGPALFAGADAIEQLWLFILAPLLGAAIAGAAYPMLFGRADEDVPGSGFTFMRARAQTVVVGPDQYQQQWNQEAGDRSQAASHTAQQPIVQDGWQWDPVGQQWHPVGQTPEQWRAQQAAQQQAAHQQAAQQQAQEQQQGQHAAAEPPIEEDPGDQTHIRPPQ